MRFLFISTKGEWGGSEPLWCEAAERALGEGHDVTVVIPQTRELHPRHQKLIELGAKFLQRPPRQDASFFNRIRWKVRGIAQPESQWWRDHFSHKPDAMCVSQGGTYCALSMPGLIPWILECGVPYLVVCHSHRNYALPDAAFRGELRRYLLGAAKVCFVAADHVRAASRYLVVALRNAIVVQNPVNLAQEEQKSEIRNAEKLKANDPRPSATPCAGVLDSPSPIISCSLTATVSDSAEQNLKLKTPSKMACVARFEIRDKGQDVLFEVLADPIWKERDFQFAFYGGGPDREILEDLISLYGLEGKVHIAGFESDIRKIWAKHELLVLPSISEGTPISLIEAQLCGRPALVTRVDGNPDWVEDGETGFLAEAPTVTHLRLALERAWENRHRWREMGEAAREACLAKRDPDPAGTLLRLLKAAAEA